MEINQHRANGESGRTLREQEDWQLTEQEIADLERVAAEETAAAAQEVTQRDWAYEMGYQPYPQAQKKTYEIRIQRLELVTIEVQAETADEAGDKALNLLKEYPEFGEVVRTDYGNMSVEDVTEEGA